MHWELFHFTFTEAWFHYIRKFCILLNGAHPYIKVITHLNALPRYNNDAYDLLFASVLLVLISPISRLFWLCRWCNQSHHYGRSSENHTFTECMNEEYKSQMSEDAKVDYLQKKVWTLNTFSLIILLFSYPNRIHRVLERLTQSRCWGMDTHT